MKAFAKGYSDQDGMDLRDYFAAKAMAIALQLHEDPSNAYVDEDGYEMGYEAGDCGTWYPHTKFFAESCYAIADLMMEARKK